MLGTAVAAIVGTKELLAGDPTPLVTTRPRGRKKRMPRSTVLVAAVATVENVELGPVSTTLRIAFPLVLVDVAKSVTTPASSEPLMLRTLVFDGDSV
jgi:hypothetical protein